MICGSATEKTRTSDFRRQTSAGLRGRCMRRPRGARVVASRGLELKVTIRGSGTLAASALARHCEATGVSLLYLTIDGTIYIPCYDNNGNVTRYLSVNGGALARYSYDAFGRLIARAGRRANFFRHRFPPTYFDSETGLYYYGRRFYSPLLKRWLNRDPIEEEGGENVFEFCEGNPVSFFDVQGLFTWEIWKKVVVYDLGYIGKNSPPHDYISGWGQRISSRNALAVTGLFWDVDVVCKCVSNKWMAVDAKGFVLPEVHMRKDKFTKRAKALILAKEEDHVKDLTTWFRSTGKKVVEDYFRTVERNRFKRYSKQSVCKRTSNEELFHEVSSALMFPVLASQEKWDQDQRGIPAPHYVKLQKNKEGVYDIAE